MDEAQKMMDSRERILRQRLSAEYKQAEKELLKEFKEYTKAFEKEDKEKRKLVRQGKLSPSEHIEWRKNKMLYKDTLKQKVDVMSQHLLNADKQARGIIRKETFGVYADQYNFGVYQVEKGLHVDTSFTLFDQKTVERMAEKNPKLLPERKAPDGKILKYSRRKVNTAITQGVLQGESIDDVAKRLTQVVGMEERYALTNARTAMTGAQNAGRLDSYIAMKKMGIKLRKQWMATLDERTRTSHQEMDGEIVDIEEKFSNELEYPGDPEGHPREVYNCRCTMIADLPDFPPENMQRLDNINKTPIDYVTYKEWAQAKIKEQNESKLKPYEDAVEKIKAEIKAKGADRVFSGIWKEDVTYADWEDKVESIEDKRNYFVNEMTKAKHDFITGLPDFDDDLDFLEALDAGDNIWNALQSVNSLAELKANKSALNTLLKFYDADDIDDIWTIYETGWEKKRYDKFKKLLGDLEEFETGGAKYADLFTKLKEAESELMQQKMRLVATDDAFSDERRRSAVWARSPKDADKVLRERCGQVWKDAPMAEREAIYEYTQSFHKFNEPLRGIEYGTERKLGVGNTNLNAAGNGERLNRMTDIIEKSFYDHDMWFNRGCRFKGMDSFLGVDMNLLKNGTEEELKAALLGKTPTEYGFMSMGSSKGQGFGGDIILNIYAPKGTKMMYAEPFSAFGRGMGYSWDGITPQRSFGGELETILQQGTQFRVVKVERRHGTIYIDLDVIGQKTPQRWKG